MTNSFSWGLSYRSAITVDYGGKATFDQISTGYPQFDAAVAQQLPFNQDIPVKTSIEFPDMASLGLAFTVTPEPADRDRRQLDRLEQLRAAEGHLRQPVRADRSARRVERRLQLPDRRQLDPEPDHAAARRLRLRRDAAAREAVGPLLPDAVRTGYSVGYGFTGRSSPRTSP